MVVGMDLCQEAIYAAKNKAKKEKLNFLTIIGDLEKLPLMDNSVDVYFCRATLHHFLCIRTVIKEISRVLKAKGKIVFIEPNGSNPFVRISTSIEKLLRNLLMGLRSRDSE